MKIEHLMYLARKKKREGEVLENIILALRERGATQAESLMVIREIENISLGEAKIAVSKSSAWSDRLEANEAVRTVAESVLDED